MKPWATVAAVTVIYSDGHTRTVACFPEEDGLDEACSEGNLGPVMDKAAAAYWTIAHKGESTYRGLGRGMAYPLSVVVTMLEGALFGGVVPPAEDREDFQTVDHKADCRVFRSYDVSGYVWMENLEDLLCKLHEMGAEDAA
jgi:hypothetical protein